ncbi:MAG: protein kinase [Anaerolineales bacterium]|nr:protein kinase [Anaerolineales bacterium]
MIKHYCINCGNEFWTADPEQVFCSDCGAEGDAEVGQAVDVTQMELPVQPPRQAAGQPVSSGDRVLERRVDWKPGENILDIYEVGQELGRGGFGAVYRVHHKAWNIDLAVKRPLKLDPGNKPIFTDEAEKWIDLGLHPHIVSCYYVRTIDDFPHTFAELVDGGSLKDWIDGGQLYEGGKGKSLERILDIAIQFAWGLAYAHEKGLVHQDVKPGNVLMTLDGVVKVTDFGLAKARRGAETPGKPVAGGDVLVSAVGGTLAFRSPEQARGDRLSIHTDIWSWGVSVLEMFTGEIYWQYGEAAAEVLEGFLEEGAQLPGLPPMPSGLSSLLSQCFLHEPARRPPNMLEVAAHLQEIYHASLGQVYPRQMPNAAELRADSLNNKALSMLDLGREDKAEGLFQQAVEADPTHPEATYHIALLSWRKNTIDDLEVVHRLERVLKALPNRWPTAYLLGLVHLERGDMESALVSLQGMQDRLDIETATRQARRRLPGAKSTRSMTGHDQGILSAALSSDMRFALSGSYDHTLRLWSLETGACLRTFEGHQGYVNSVRFSPDGRHALSGSSDETLRLWEIQTGECLRVFTGHKYDINAVAFHPSGALAVSASSDETLKLWEIATGACLRTFAGHARAVTCAVFTPDGKHILSGSHDNSLLLWDAQTGEQLRKFEGHEQSVYCLALSPDGRLVYSGSGGTDPEELNLRLWDVHTGACLRAGIGHRFGINSVAFSPDGRYALTCGMDWNLRLWEVRTGVCLRTFEGHRGDVNTVCFSPDGRQALSGAKDKVLHLWDLDGIGAVKAPYCLAAPVSGMQATDQAKLYNDQLDQARSALQRKDYAAVLKHARRARDIPGYERSESLLEIWSELYQHCKIQGLQGGWCAKTFQGHERGVNAAVFSLDGSLMLSGSHDTTIRVWDLNTGQCLRRFEESRFDVKSLAIHPNGRHVLSDYDVTLGLWEVETGKRLRTFEKHDLVVFSAAVSPDGRHALSDSGRVMHLWDVKTGRCLRTFEGHKRGVGSVAFSPDGRYALSGSFDKTLRLWEIRTGLCLKVFEGHEAVVRSIAFSPDGRFVLSGSNDHTLRLWRVDTAACLRIYNGHSTEVSAVTFSPDGRFALSGGYDNTVRLWDVETGNCLRSFEGHTSSVTCVAFSAEARFILSGSDDNTLRLWILDWELEDQEPANWDEGARPYLENFLTLHTPYAGTLPQDRQPTEEQITLALTRRGKPTWKEEDFKGLLTTLGCAGYGWLRPEGVRRELERMAAERGKNV